MDVEHHWTGTGVFTTYSYGWQHLECWHLVNHLSSSACSLFSARLRSKKFVSFWNYGPYTLWLCQDMLYFLLFPTHDFGHTFLQSEILLAAAALRVGCIWPSACPVLWTFDITFAKQIHSKHSYSLVKTNKMTNPLKSGYHCSLPASKRAYSEITWFLWEGLSLLFSIVLQLFRRSRR